MTASLRIAAMPASSVDIGDRGIPGTAASQITCDISARRDGRWDATGRVSTGTNQGCFSEDRSYGPWTGRGDTAADAAADMVGRAEPEHQDAMRRASHDAILECDGLTWASLAACEAARISGVLTGADRNQRGYAVVAGLKYYGAAEELDALRRRAVKILGRMAAGGGESLASITDTDLLAEVAWRGLTAQE